VQLARAGLGTSLQLLAQRPLFLYRGFAPPVVYPCFGWPATNKGDFHLLTIDCHVYNIFYHFTKPEITAQ
jgi:hypothetical protein